MGLLPFWGGGFFGLLPAVALLALRAVSYPPVADVTAPSAVVACPLVVSGCVLILVSRYGAEAKKSLMSTGDLRGLFVLVGDFRQISLCSCQIFIQYISFPCVEKSQKAANSSGDFFRLNRTFLPLYFVIVFISNGMAIGVFGNARYFKIESLAILIFNY